MSVDSPIVTAVTRWQAFCTRRRVIALTVLLALVLRLWAAWQLPGDYDEPIYLQVGGDFAEMIRQGDWAGILSYGYNTEHPPLVKLLYAVGYLSFGENHALLFARLLSAFFGGLAVLAVAVIEPLAGLGLAVQTLAVKYTSQAYLEALPLLTSTLAVLWLWQAHTPRSPRFWLSAAALGLTAASKYSYVSILAVVLFLLWDKKTSPLYAAAYLATSGGVFLAFDPALWADPIGQLAASLSFHPAYAQSAHVQQSGYGWYQPLLWISRSWGYVWHPQVFFYFGFDGLIFLLALAGLPGELRQRRWVAVWLTAGLLSALLWPTKWPQYTLVLLPALCLTAASGARALFRWAMEQESYYNWFSEMLPRPTPAVRVVSALFVGAIVLGGAIYYATMFVNRLGWTHFDAFNSPLPANGVNALLALPDGRMAIGSDGGLALFDPDAQDAARWQIFTTRSGLPHERVLALAAGGPGDSLWVGTAAGLARLTAAGGWDVFHAAEMGLPGDQVNALAVAPEGHLWVGTNRGAAFFDGQRWTALRQADSGLSSDFVLSLAVQERWVWFGTQNGLARLDRHTHSWQEFTAEQGLGWGGIAALLVDSRARLWVATLGGGLSVWDDGQWTHYRVSNSALPFNSVQAVLEGPPGVYWVSVSIPNDVGGLIARFDGHHWRVYRPVLSGYSGAETIALARDDAGRIWFGTRTRGVEIYQP